MSRAVVITGSTRGLGFALAAEFLLRGCRVTVSGRSAGGVEAALERLQAHGERVMGFPCDVTQEAQVEALWREAVRRWGGVDIWVNNAGVPHSTVPVWELPAAEAETLVRTNLLGTVQGSAVAMRGMLSQAHGQIFNMEGFGSDGRRRTGLTLYGTSKAAVRYFSRGLADEADGGPVLTGTLSPGMMVTDFLLGPMQRSGQAEQMKRVINILADRPETVARFLVPRMLENRRQGARIAWLTGGKILFRFLTAPLRRGRLLP